jgi:tetratricopeptide (TPR) repeat protein
MTRCLVWSFVIILGLSACAVNPAERMTAGNDYYSQGAYEEALKAYQAAQVTSPDSAGTYFNAADAFAQVGKLKEAIAALNQAFKTADDDLTAKGYYNLGNIYFEMSLYDEAIQAYQQTLLRKPDDEDARYNLELALSRIVPPSATPLPQPDADGAQATATPNSENEGLQTSTPLAQESPTPSPLAENTTPPPSQNNVTREEAENLLDSVQQNQHTLPGREPQQSTDTNSPEEDW